MKDPNDIDFTTLNWVKQELDETLRQARQALEAFVEDQSEKSQLKYCATYLHQVQGTLRMVELYGAAMVIEEMEKVTLALVNGEIKQSDETLEVLVRGLVQMPDYLGRLQGGHRDIPIVLLPLLNDLRACRSEKLLSETALFSPNLAMQLPGSAAGASSALPDAAMRQNAGKFRLAFQFGLLKWFKGDDVDGNLGRLIAILDRLRAMSVQVDAQRLWWISSGVLEGVLLKALDPSVAVKLLYGKVDREIKKLVDEGEAGFSKQPPSDLTKSLLYYAAHSQRKGARITEIKQLYHLDTLLPSQSEIEHANSALSGRNRALLDTVGSAIKEDVMRVKDGLDMYLRGPQDNVNDLAPQGETLQRVADTLGVLGLGIPRKVVIEQRDIVTNIVTGRQPPAEQTLLDVAGALLFVESSLDDYIERLGQGQSAPQESAATLRGLELPQAEVRRILDATMKEATVNLSQAKQDIVAFIESPWDHGKIEGIPKLLEEISGALRMLNMPEPAELNDGVAKFIEVELLRHKRVPTSEQLDLMADALASIEYYLEAIREARPNRDRILEVTRRSLESLGYWPLPDPNALGTSASLDFAPASNEFVSFPDDFQSQRIESLANYEAVSPSAEASSVPALSLSDIPLTEAQASAVTPESSELNLDGFVVAQAETTPQPQVLDLSLDLPEPAPELVPNPDESAFAGFDLSLLDEAPETSQQADEVSLAKDHPAQTSVAEADPILATEPEAFEDFQSLFEGNETDAASRTAVEEPEAVALSELDLDLASLMGESAPDEKASSESTFDFSALETPVEAEPVLPQVELSPEPSAAALVATEETDLVEIVAPVIAPVETKKVDTSFPASGFQMVPSDDIDDEIREVFVEEVEDELAGLAKYFPAWRADQNDFEKLKPVRRSFHTLKGSGRLVGALAIGEFSWKIENMLNRVLDKSIPVSPAVVACLEEAIGALPQLLAGLRGEGAPSANIGGMMYVADRVSAGEEIYLPKNEPAPLETAAEPAVAHAEAGAVAEVELINEPEGAAIVAVATASAPEPVSFEPVVAVPPGARMVNFTATFSAEELPLPDALANDPTLVEILKSEAVTHVGVMMQFLARIAQSGAAEPVSDELLRAVHTLNGAIAMVDLPFVSEVVGPLEGLLKRLKNQGGVVGSREAIAISETAYLVDRTMQGIERGDVRGIDSGELQRYVVGLRDKLPEPEIPMLHALMDDGMTAEEERELGELLGEESISPALETEIPADLDVLLDQQLVEADEAVEAETAHGAVDAIEADAELEPVDAVAAEAAVETLDSNDSVGSEDIELIAIADLKDIDSSEAELALDEAASDDAEALLLERSDQLVADLAKLEELTFAPLNPHPSDVETVGAIEVAAADAAGEAELFANEAFELSDGVADEGSAATAAEHTAPSLVDNISATESPEGETESAEYLDLSFLEADAVESIEPTAHALDGFHGLAIAESEVTLERADPLVEQELVELDDLAIVEFESSDVAQAIDADASFAELGLFDELEVASEQIAPAAEQATTYELPQPQAAEEMLVPAVETIEQSDESGEFADLDALLFDDLDSVGEFAKPSEVSANLNVETALADHSEALAELAPAELALIEEAEAIADLELPRHDLEINELAHAEEHVSEVELDWLNEVAEQAQPEIELADAEPAPSPGALTVAVAEPIAVAAQSTESAATASAPAPIVFEPLSSDTPASSGVSIVPIAPDLDPTGPLQLADPDEELLEIFVQEGTDILDTADNMMARLRDTPEDMEIVIGLQRELHTLKGGARMAGINPVGDLAHSMESLFEAIVDKRASNSPVAMEALERSFDRLHQMVTRVGSKLAVAAPENVIARLDALVDGREDEFMVEAAAEQADVPALAAVVEPAVTPAKADTAKAPSAAPAPARVERKTALDEDENAQRQQQESIRVRADLIDNLVNYAGEVSIYRSRLEAQIGGFRFNLQEFDQTVARLRDQLRKLEMETEAQILSRYQREEAKKDVGFDPLELDRFSTLQQLSRALAESVSDLVSLQSLMDDIARQSETLLLQQSRVSSELQEGLMRTRMIPFDSLVPRLRRIMRQTGGELGKRANLKVEGSQGEMDRTVMDRMTAPLEHMLRNALAHGLETPQQRKAAGKPEDGNVTIAVSRDATEVVIKVTDDGKGLDRDAIRSKAVERGLLREDAQLSDRDLFQFILETGFSTATTVSKVAGRGVGMDVVNSEIKQLGGSLLIDSVKGVGSVFTIRLPFTLSVTQAILIKLADTSYAVPLSSVQGVIRMPRKELDRRIANNELEVSYAGESYQIYDLGELIRQPIAYAKDESQVPLVMTRSGDQRAAIRVSQVVGSKEVVVKAVGVQLSSVPGFFGATIMGDGSVIVILDLAPLVRHGAALRQAPELASELDLDVVVTTPVETRRQKLVMVVDDSITMRKVTTRVLERNDLEVITAKDGLDAVEQLQDRVPDLMLLDIEMPRMDGYELATYVKNDSRLKHIPIIMITSRTGEKHRQRAMEIGVERYLGKPYQEVDLLKNVMESLNGVNAK